MADATLRLNAARTAVANKYGNLYGLKLKNWFVFNGEIAVPKGDDTIARKANLARFEEHLRYLRKSNGTSATHTKRRAV